MPNQQQQPLNCLRQSLFLLKSASFCNWEEEIVRKLLPCDAAFFLAVFRHGLTKQSPAVSRFEVELIRASPSTYTGRTRRRRTRGQLSPLFKPQVFGCGR